ncbi:MAG: arginine--tRNA ligase, partial [Deltaproteobacteria bacterium]
DLGKGKKVIIEFVSANPTGPLHIGHARGAALGDSLSRIMDFLGYRVTKEFYINDAGQQIRLLGESIYSRYKQLSEPDYPFPENGYHGEYIIELAQMISKETDLSSMPKEEAVRFCAERGKEIMLEQIKKDLEAFKVSFDTWFSEKSLYESGLLSKTLNELKNKGLLYEKDGAVWIKTSQFGDDKDRVLRKSDGQFTYFASDIAYHLDKKKRGFDQAINIWGADHHGYIPRLKAALVSQGFPEDWLRVLLIQLVKLWKEGKEVKMSKRSGEFITFRELMDEVGVDAMRFVFLTKSHDSTLDCDIDLVKTQDAENPVYYVQYAHARICSILRKAKERGISFRTPDIEELSCLKLPEEIELIRNVVEFPYVLKEIALHLEPHRLTYYLTSLASVFHRYFNLGTSRPELRVVSDDSALTNARLALAEAVRVVIEKGLTLLGVSAPERM